MKKKLTQTIEIPQEVEVIINKEEIIVKGPEGENKRLLKRGKISLTKEGNKIIIEHDKSSKKEKKLMNTLAAHIKNMIQGVQKKI